MFSRPLFTLFLAILICPQVSGQQDEYFNLRKYTQNEGLSSYNITKIVRDRQGYLWIGTQDGLNRFDGRDFLIFKDDPDAHYRLFGNNVSDIIEDTLRNILWVSTSYGGITGIGIATGKVAYHLTEDNLGNQLSRQWVRTLAIRGDILWIGTNQGLLAYDISKTAYLDEKADTATWQSAATASIHKLLVDPEQNLWVCSPDLGLSMLPRGERVLREALSLRQLGLAGKNKALAFWDIIQAGPGKLLIATSMGVRSVEYTPGSRPKTGQLPSFLYDREVFSCALDANNAYWFSNAAGLYRYEFGPKRLVKLKDADFSLTNWQSSIYQIYPDEDHNIWFGCQEGLALYRNQRSPFTAYCKSSGSDTKIQHTYSILPLSDTVILCGAQDGFYRINTKNKSIDKIDEGDAGLLIYQHTPGETFLSNAHGLMILEGNSLRPAARRYPCLAPLQNDLLNSALRYNDSLVIFGSQRQKGIYLWNLATQQLTNYNASNSGLELYNNFCNTLYRDDGGYVWILSQSGAVRFDPVSKKSAVFRINNPATGQSCPILFDIRQVGEHYFFAAYGIGVVETDKDLHTVRVITTKDDLANNGVYKILSYRDSLLFITTNNGLSALNLRTSEIRNYYQSDGLHSSAFEELCAVKINDRIYAGGVNGFSVIEPQWLSVNAVAPRLYVNSIKTENAAGAVNLFNAGISSMELPNDVLQTSLYFSCINYSNPDRTAFAYRLTGLQESWIELGHQNFIDLVGIGPGKYTLEVKAANEDGVWSAPIAVEMTFLPKWYQRWWFRIVLGSIPLGVVFWVYRQRIDRLKTLQKIRNRLAIDLHDDLGSTLNSIKVYANLALRESQKDDYLEQIRQNAQEAIQSVRDIIWVMNEKAGTIEHLVTRLSMFAGPLCAANGISLKKDIGAEVFPYNLEQEEKKHLYLILKEGINNSIKYSAASEITLRVFFLKEKPVFILKDNGEGFIAGGPSEGNGLKNMRERAQSVKYLIDIRSSAGTTIELQKQ